MTKIFKKIKISKAEKKIFTKLKLILKYFNYLNNFSVIPTKNTGIQRFK